MSCSICGHDASGSHHLGCVRVVRPTLTDRQAIEAGFLPAEVLDKEEAEYVEVLKEGSMTTVPVSHTCEFGECDNPKYSDHPRVKFCEEHRDPKNRKE